GLRGGDRRGRDARAGRHGDLRSPTVDDAPSRTPTAGRRLREPHALPTVARRPPSLPATLAQGFRAHASAAAWPRGRVARPDERGRPLVAVRPRGGRTRTSGVRGPPQGDPQRTVPGHLRHAPPRREE